MSALPAPLKATCKACGFFGPLRVRSLREIPVTDCEQTVRVITDTRRALKDFMVFECIQCNGQGFVPDQFSVQK